MASHRHESTAGLVVQGPYEAIVRLGPLLDIPIEPDSADDQMPHRRDSAVIAWPQGEEPTADRPLPWAPTT
jgi:hypothetical protein